MDNRLDCAPLVVGGGKGVPLSGGGAAGLTSAADGGSPPGPQPPDGTEKGSREADGSGELGALLLLSATSDDLMSVSHAPTGNASHCHNAVAAPTGDNYYLKQICPMPPPPAVTLQIQPW